MKKDGLASAYKRVIEKMKADKKFEAAVYIFILVLLVSAYILLGKGSESEQTVKTEQSGALEKKLELTLESMRGVGDAYVMINYGAENSVDGVIVVAEGADDIMVRGSIQSAVQTLLGVDSEKVGVYRSKDKQDE